MDQLRQTAQQALEALIESARLLGSTQARQRFGCYSQEDARLERVWDESIARHKASIIAALERPEQAEPSASWPSGIDIADEIDALLPRSMGYSTRAAIETWWRDLVQRRLEQTEQAEPVAWMYKGIKSDGTEHGPYLVWKPAHMDAMSASKGAQAKPLYAAPLNLA
jgi:hypothetical protein